MRKYPILNKFDSNLYTQIFNILQGLEYNGKKEKPVISAEPDFNGFVDCAEFGLRILRLYGHGRSIPGSSTNK